MQPMSQAANWAASAPDPMVPQQYRVKTVQQELPGVFTMDLQLPAGETEFRFEPGQFNMLYRFGVGEVPISVSGDPSKPHKLTHTIRAVGAVTDGLQGLAPGAMVGVRGPFGSSWPTTSSEGADIVVLAGGIGLAPLRPLIYHVIANRDQYGSVCLFYGARTPEEMLYRDELTQWRARFDLKVEAIVDRAGPEWRGKVGVVTKLLGTGGFSPVETVAYICGPEIMIRYGVMALNEQGIPNQRIFASLERNMKCALGFCGHCQFGSSFVCRDGPVFRFDAIEDRFNLREI